MLLKAFDEDTLSKTRFKAENTSKMNHALVDHPIKLMSNASFKSDIWGSMFAV